MSSPAVLQLDRPQPASEPGSPAALLGRADAALRAAASAPAPDERFAAAHLAALRTAAAVVAAQGRPPSLRRRLMNVWVLLERVAPEFADEAGYFAAGAKVRAAIEAGAYAVASARDADDQLRAAVGFRNRVQAIVGEPVPALAG